MVKHDKGADPLFAVSSN